MDWIQSFYFSVVTLTTVGYGDLHPTTEVSRLFTALFVLLGVAIVLVSLGIIWKNLLRQTPPGFGLIKDPAF